MGDYDSIDVNENEMEQVHNMIDQIDAQDQQIIDEVPERPESLNNTMTKYRIQADIPNDKRKYFQSFKSFYGTHVALSNTKRQDNLGYLDAVDLCMIYENIPMLRHRGTQVKIRETSHFQMTRGNEKVGGFEAELGLVNIIRQDASIRRNPILVQQNKPKKFMGIFPRKQKTNTNLINQGGN